MKEIVLPVESGTERPKEGLYPASVLSTLLVKPPLRVWLPLYFAALDTLRRDSWPAGIFNIGGCSLLDILRQGILILQEKKE